jgi:hypothetical protein
VHPGVVADVDDRGQFVVAGRCLHRSKLAQSQQPLHTEEEAGAADPADQNCDLHIARQYARMRRCPCGPVRGPSRSRAIVYALRQCGRNGRGTDFTRHAGEGAIG